MADEAKAKAEKLAAAKKRVEELKKKKAKKDGTKTEATPKASSQASKAEEPAAEDHPAPEAALAEETIEDVETPSEDTVEPKITTRARPASISLQSKARSASFRASTADPSSPAQPFSPEGETAPDIYRKQASRIDELEKENKRLAKEAGDGERRWKKAEEELEVLREADGTGSTVGDAGNSEEIERLKTEVAALQRLNTQLQAESTRRSRHGSSPSVSLSSPPSDLSAQLASKSSTIESMEVEISNLRAQLARTASGSSAEKEQIAALEDKVSRTQKAFDNSQRELLDLKKNLERTTEKAVKEGSERTSAETKLRTLTRESEEAKGQSVEFQKKIEGLEKKVLTLTTLHKEHDARSQILKKEREKGEKETTELRAKLAALENENLRLREERERAKKREASGADDDGVDELEDEERQRLEQKIRDLEAEISDLRRGIWKERRKEFDGGDSGMTSPGAKFTDIDLGGMSPTRRRSIAQGPAKGLQDLLSSGFNAFTGANGGDQLLEDDELDFDEDAFRLAQEEEAKKRIERIKEIKRGLTHWNGWRLDVVEARRGFGGVDGEIFEV